MDRITGMKLPLHYPERNGESGDRGVHWEKSETEIGETERGSRGENSPWRQLCPAVKSSEFGVGQNWAPDPCLDLLCYKPLGMLLKIKNVGGQGRNYLTGLGVLN